MWRWKPLIRASDDSAGEYQHLHRKKPAHVEEARKVRQKSCGFWAKLHLLENSSSRGRSCINSCSAYGCMHAFMYEMQLVAAFLLSWRQDFLQLPTFQWLSDLLSLKLSGSEGHGALGWDVFQKLHLCPSRQQYCGWAEPGTEPCLKYELT